MSKFVVEWVRGSGPGGQHRNKTENACRLTDPETGLQAYADERSRRQSYRLAMQALESKIQAQSDRRRSERKKARRDEAIQPQMHIRTYNEPRNEVKDHRTGKTAPFREILRKGRLDRLK